jgi:hypothetical protein
MRCKAGNQSVEGAHIGRTSRILRPLAASEQWERSSAISRQIRARIATRSVVLKRWVSPLFGRTAYCLHQAHLRSLSSKLVAPTGRALEEEPALHLDLPFPASTDLPFPASAVAPSSSKRQGEGHCTSGARECDGSVQLLHPRGLDNQACPQAGPGPWACLHPCACTVGLQTGGR